MSVLLYVNFIGRCSTRDFNKGYNIQVHVQVHSSTKFLQKHDWFQMLDPDAKSLVFSTWTDVLDILASALIENDIPFAALQDQGKFKRNLEKFKVWFSSNWIINQQEIESLCSLELHFYTKIYLNLQWFEQHNSYSIAIATRIQKCTQLIILNVIVNLDGFINYVSSESGRR